ECPAQRGYHIDDFSLWCEIVDAAPDGYGELVYTTLSRQVMPLIRYRSTDVTAFINEPCTCTMRITRRLAKIRGRLDEIVNCGIGFNLTPWALEQFLDDLPGITRDWQVGVTRRGNIDVLDFRLELLPDTPAETVQATIKQRVMQRFPD